MKESKILYLKRISKLFSINYYIELIALISITIISIVLGRVMDAAALGIYSLVLMTATLFRMVAESGYDYEILTEIPTNHDKVYPLMLESQKSKNFILTATLPLMLIYFYFSVGDLVCLLVIPYNYLASVTYNFKTVLRALNELKRLSKVESIYSITLLITAIPIILITKSIFFLFLIYIMLEFLKIILLKNAIGKTQNIRSPKIYELLTLSMNKAEIIQISKSFILRKDFVLLNLNTVLQNRIAFYVLGIIGTSSEKGIYTAAYRFISFVRSIPWALLSILLPDFSEKIKKGEQIELKNGLVVVAFIGGLVSFPMWYLSDFMIAITFKFGIASDILKILSWSFIPIMLNTVMESFLVANGNKVSVNIAMLISIIFSFFSSMILYSYISVYGIAYSYLLSEILLFVIYFIVYQRSKRK